jgi:hypothetical protein
MAPGSRIVVTLATPPLPCVVPEGVFDAFGWCASDVLEWGRPAARPFDAGASITPANPPAMVFVMRGAFDDVPWLPRELAALHAGGMGLEGESCLAPWAIDDATDRLHEQRARPRDVMWLAAGALDALFWGLHDWAHFHNHGPFERRAWTEMQCDVAALAWLWINREAAGLDAATWERARREVVAIGAARFAEEGEPFDATPLDAAALQRAARTMRS